MDVFTCAARASTTSRTSTSTSRATRWWCSPGVSGSGKSSLAFGTLYAEAQRRYLESVSPYARRLFHQMAVPEVDEIDGLPPAVALQQQRGSPTTRSSVGSVTTLSNLLRMLYSRAGDYPPRPGAPRTPSRSRRTRPRAPARAATASAAIYEVDRALDGARRLADHPRARDRRLAARVAAARTCATSSSTLGYDVDRPWRDLPKKDRDWILFTDEQPTVPVYAGLRPGARRDARSSARKSPATRAPSRARGATCCTRSPPPQSALMKKRGGAATCSSTDCPLCHGKRLRAEALSVTFAGLDIADMSRLPLKRLAQILGRTPTATAPSSAKSAAEHPEKAIVAQRIARGPVDAPRRCCSTSGSAI